VVGGWGGGGVGGGGGGVYREYLYHDNIATGCNDNLMVNG